MSYGRIVVTPLKKRLVAYERFRELLARGKPTDQIVCTVSRRFGVSRGAIYAWTKGASPLGKRAGRIICTEELFYVIGSLLGMEASTFGKTTITFGYLEKENSA